MAVRKLGSSNPTHFYSMPVADVGGLDPKVYRVSLSVERLDAEPLSDDECLEIERVFAALASAAAPPQAPGGQGKPKGAKGGGKSGAKAGAKAGAKGGKKAG